MKRMMTLVSFYLAFTSLAAFAQGYMDEEPASLDNETIYREEGSTFTEINPPFTDEVAHPEIERQEEDVFYSDLPNDEWVLEGEELPIENWEGN